MHVLMHVVQISNHCYEEVDIDDIVRVRNLACTQRFVDEHIEDSLPKNSNSRLHPSITLMKRG